MQRRSLGDTRKVVWVADPSWLMVPGDGAGAAVPPLANEQRVELVRFLIVGEKVTARMAFECGESLDADTRVALTEVASETSRFDAMLCHYLARRGRDARATCGSLERRAVALLRDRLARIEGPVARIGFLNALQEGVTRRLRSELPRVQDDLLARPLQGLLEDLERRCSRSRHIRRNLARLQAYNGEGHDLLKDLSSNWSVRADYASWTRVH